MRIAIAAAALCAGTLLASPASADTVSDQVKAAYAAWDAALNKGDAKAVAAFYATDAKLLPPDHNVYEGPAGAEKFFAGIIGAGVTGHKLEMLDADGGDALAAAAAKWSAQGKDASGKPAAFGGVATHVFEKQADGSLKLRMHTFN